MLMAWSTAVPRPTSAARLAPSRRVAVLRLAWSLQRRRAPLQSPRQKLRRALVKRRSRRRGPLSQKLLLLWSRSRPKWWLSDFLKPHFHWIRQEKSCHDVQVHQETAFALSVCDQQVGNPYITAKCKFQSLSGLSSGQCINLATRWLCGIGFPDAINQTAIYKLACCLLSGNVELQETVVRKGTRTFSFQALLTLNMTSASNLIFFLKPTYHPDTLSGLDSSDTDAYR